MLPFRVIFISAVFGSLISYNFYGRIYVDVSVFVGIAACFLYLVVDVIMIIIQYRKTLTIKENK
jgi:hypothetical protein